MDKALYKNDTEIKIINAYDITPLEYQEKYKGNLYCTGEGCSAELVHMELQKRGDIRCFRTLQNSKHIDGCPYEVIKSGKIRRIGKSGEVVNVELTEKHVNDILNDTFKKATGQTKNPSGKSSDIKKRKKKKQDDVLTGDGEVSNGQLKATPGGNVVEGVKSERQPFVYKKSVSEMLRNAESDTYSLYGKVDKIELFENEAFITILDDAKEKIKVYFGTPFIDNNEQEFKYLKFFKYYFEECRKKGQDVVCVAVCFRRELAGEIVGEVMDYHYVRLDNRTLYGIRNMLMKMGY